MSKSESREERALLPCPFCGGEAVSIDQCGDAEFDVSCFSCRAGTIACGPSAANIQDAKKAWNTRSDAERPARTAEVEVERAVLPTAQQMRDAETIVNSAPVIAQYAACEWDDLGDDGKTWIAAIIREAALRPPAQPSALVEAERRQCSICTAIVASYPQGMCCHCYEMPWPLAALSDASTGGAG